MSLRTRSIRVRHSASRVPLQSSLIRTSEGDGPTSSHGASDEQGKSKAKPVKYPIEDLALDPTSIFDGRLLRRQNAETPPLPQKPLFSRDLPVEKQHFPAFSFVWSMLNIFGSVQVQSALTTRGAELGHLLQVASRTVKLLDGPVCPGLVSQLNRHALRTSSRDSWSPSLYYRS